VNMAGTFPAEGIRGAGAGIAAPTALAGMAGAILRDTGV
jgi:hypothetical protein